MSSEPFADQFSADVGVGETGADVVGAIIVCDGSGRSFAISKHSDVLHVKHQ